MGNKQSSEKTKEQSGSVKEFQEFTEKVRNAIRNAFGSENVPSPHRGRDRFSSSDVSTVAVSPSQSPAIGHRNGVGTNEATVVRPSFRSPSNWTNDAFSSSEENFVQISSTGAVSHAIPLQNCPRLSPHIETQNISSRQNAFRTPTADSVRLAPPPPLRRPDVGAYPDVHTNQNRWRTRGIVIHEESDDENVTKRIISHDQKYGYAEHGRAVLNKAFRTPDYYKGNCISNCDDGDEAEVLSTRRGRKIDVKKINENCEIDPSLCAVQWRDEDVIAEIESLERRVAVNIVKLFDEDNTIPFIARYRKDMTGNMDPDQLRRVKESYDMVKKMRSKAETILKQSAAQKKLDQQLVQKVNQARSLNELEIISAPFKEGSKGTLAERAKKLGLEEPAKNLLYGSKDVFLTLLVNPRVEGLENNGKVKEGLKHIISDIISKTEDVVAALEEIKKSNKITVESKEKKSDNPEDAKKFELYFDFKQDVRRIQPHQMLAINRGETLKFLSVKINVPDELWNPIRNYCKRLWLGTWMTNQDVSSLRKEIIEESIEDSIKRHLIPTVTRQIRSNLNKEAEKESINVFVQNLRQLLLMKPYRGKAIVAIDPGLGQGCKVAVVDETGTVKSLDKFYLPDARKSPKVEMISANKLRDLLFEFNCETIALGNGKGCRQTEAFLKNLLKQKFFEPLDVGFTIVDESGVSIYSCSPLAQEEYPGLDPLFISAISLARRLQDPLGEYVKVEPKHLGVGMYQHDASEKKLENALEEVVSECVSFVGVDVNSASSYLLKRVAGLSEAKAKKIIEWRLENGPFRCRQELKRVKNIGPKTYQQCAGFIRIIPSTAGAAPGRALNPLDRTWIHPESYELTLKILEQMELNVKDLGSDQFIRTVNERLKGLTAEGLAAAYDVSPLTMSFILDALSRSPDHDLRSLSKSPCFSKGTMTLEELSPGDVVTGVVRNVVNFGAFVDVGVGQNGLIHNSKMKNVKLNLNDRVEVRVQSIETGRKRIGLELVAVK